MCCSIRNACAALACFLAGVLAATCLPGHAQDPAATAVKIEQVPGLRGLDANLWMRISAEYHACCLQAFQLAKQKLVKPQEAKLPPAVVLDLDETALDNGYFQYEMLLKNSAYNQPAWDKYEETGAKEVRLVPGAKQFLDAAKEKGFAVFYITNRNDKYRAGTMQALKLLGIEVPEECLLCSTTTSDKTERRKAVEAKHTVVLYVGDNLRDFDDKFRSTATLKSTDEEIKASILKRKQQVDADAALFGSKWIILPNPAYGEWAKVLGGPRDLEWMK